MEGLGFWLASEAITHAAEVNGTTAGVISRQTDAANDTSLVESVANKISQIMGDAPTIFVDSSWGHESASLTVFGSSLSAIPIVQGLLHDRFHDRLVYDQNQNLKLSISTLSSWKGEEDEEILWAIVKEAAATASPLPPPLSTAEPLKAIPAPPGARSIDEILAQARSRFDRLDPTDAYSELLSNTESNQTVLLVDIRPEAQRHEEGEIPGALKIERNVLEWRFDPQSDARIKEMDSYDKRIILFCSEGYASSLAVVSLLEMGLTEVTDIEGGFKNWKRSGLPTEGGIEH